MAVTYEPITSTTLSTTATSVTLSSIPGTYTDLVLVSSIPSVGGGNNARGFRFELNGDSSTNYSGTYLQDASTTRETNDARGRIGSVSETTNDVTTGVAHFNNYSNTTTYKSVIGRSGNLNSNNDATIFVGVALWRSTAAITSIKLTMTDNGSFQANTVFTLYGIKAA